MFHPIWRLSEAGEHSLGLACNEEGLVLGRTPLLERRDGRFVVRNARDIQRLLSRAYRTEVDSAPLLGGLTTVAAALNANDLLLVHIAAVHLRIPDLPDQAARDALEAEDRLIKYARGGFSGSAFERGLQVWDIKESDGIFQIAGNTRGPHGWVDDPEQITTFPPGTSVDRVIDRMIAILQEAARQ
jgi:hypothetical protein